MQNKKWTLEDISRLQSSCAKKGIKLPDYARQAQSKLMKKNIK